MELLAVVCLCLLTWSGTTFAAGNGPDVIKMVVKEGDDAILPCSLSTREDIAQKLFDWKKDGQELLMCDGGKLSGPNEQFKGRVSHFPDQLQFGNASIVIRNTKVTDSGTYTCIFPRLQTGRLTFNISLIVGAAAKPFAKVLNVTESEVWLKCEVPDAFPKPEVEWKDSDGNTLPAKKLHFLQDRRGHFSVTLLTTVAESKTNHFLCTAKQEEIHHIAQDDVFVPGNSGADRNIPGSTLLLLLVQLSWFLLVFPVVLV